MSFRDIVKKAWQIRKEAAANFNCPVMEIIWGDCFRLAKKEIEMADICIEIEGEKIGDRWPWVAKIIGPHPKYALEREFLRGDRDWSQSNSKGSRGIKDTFLIEEPGIYEYRIPTSWQHDDRGFVEITATGERVELGKMDVIRRVNA